MEALNGAAHRLTVSLRYISNAPSLPRRQSPALPRSHSAASTWSRRHHFSILPFALPASHGRNPKFSMNPNHQIKSKSALAPCILWLKSQSHCLMCCSSDTSRFGPSPLPTPCPAGLGCSAHLRYRVPCLMQNLQFRDKLDILASAETRSVNVYLAHGWLPLSNNMGAFAVRKYSLADSQVALLSHRCPPTSTRDVLKERKKEKKTKTNKIQEITCKIVVTKLSITFMLNLRKTHCPLAPITILFARRLLPGSRLIALPVQSSYTSQPLHDGRSTFHPKKKKSGYVLSPSRSVKAV